MLCHVSYIFLLLGSLDLTCLFHNMRPWLWWNHWLESTKRRGTLLLKVAHIFSLIGYNTCTSACSSRWDGIHNLSLPFPYSWMHYILPRRSFDCVSVKYLSYVRLLGIATDMYGSVVVLCFDYLNDSNMHNCHQVNRYITLVLVQKINDFL